MYDDYAARTGAVAVVRLGVLVFLTVMSFSAAAQGVTFTVNRTGDTPGACTTTLCNLRQAITAANATAAKDTIVFNIPACGTRNINITGDTLHITHPIIIDGTTQPLCGTPVPGDRTSLIEIRGPGVSVTPNGTILHGLVLDAASGGSEIRGLAINGFSGSGIGINSSNNSIIDNKVGTDATGRQARPNSIGITVGTSTVGNDVGDNIVSANQSTGIDVLGDGTQIYENVIGVSVDGDPLGNGGDGISTFSANNTEIGLAAAIGNTIAFNGGAGIRIGIGNFNEVIGNKIFSNLGRGVDLIGTGANHAQVAPVLTSAVRSIQVVSTSPPRLQTVTTIQGTLANVGGSSSFRVDLYGNDECDGSGAGEGQKFLKTATVSSNGSFSASTTLPSGAVITAIARSPDGDSSEFSVCRSVTSL